MDSLVLENKRLKAISCDTRLKILKVLYKHTETLSDLAKKMSLQKSTIKDHLTILEDAKLLKQIESNNIWKYYELTEDAKCLINPSGVKVLIAFSITTIITFVFGIKIWFSGYSKSKLVSTVLQSSNVASDSVYKNYHSIDYIWILFIVFLTVSIILLAFYIYRKRKVCRCGR